ncbi:SH3 domain-containing protein [Chitinimonas lacunae]|uniref:SH3 domain-containing protein n=1 Tax=Chitinimonas lacunae TaxID=1963018 RepID=A0ABV8MRT9_9NEIS
MKILVSLGLLCCALTALADSGTLARNAELRQKPFGDAAKLADLAANSRVEILTRQGAWMQVKTEDGRQGWVKMLNVRTSSGERAAAGGGVASVVGLVTTGRSGKTTTTGVKGIDEEQLGHTEPNTAELAKLKSYHSSREEAARFANSARLSARQVDYLAGGRQERRRDEPAPRRDSADR